MSLHYVALGDSTTVGVGDPLNGSTTELSGAGARPGDGWRGWASLLADALGSSHRVTFSNHATSGATVPIVAADQLPALGAVWLVKEGVPWLGRRAGDLTPWAARMILTQYRGPANAEVRRIEA
ncbi:SGNH/GDSL hydrolase family protein [Kribbella amoyensis]|uniref:SGNH/GDSL hydrolase family protein n=1 Tax=Kribbella amoyensis TaxID=996641 RepID=UPI00119FC246|nr:SGNH/GDSL hydrolase family protein [Kribbella amoyensis]